MKIIIRSFLVILLSFLSITVSAKSFLWEIKDKDNSLFLLGSVHLLKESDYPLDKAIFKAFDRSNIIVFEADLAELTSPKVQQEMLKNALLPQGQTLRSLLHPDLYKTTAEKMHRNGMMIEVVNGFKPWMVAITLQMAEFKRLGFKAEYGVDQFLYRRAKMKGKKIIGLETPEFQISLFSKLSIIQQQQFLAQTVLELDSSEKIMHNLLASWKSGDSKKFYNYNIDSFKQFPELMDKILIQRNKNWMERILKIMEGNQDAMVVVGALHLPGEEGVLDLLSKEGYKAIQH